MKIAIVQLNIKWEDKVYNKQQVISYVKEAKNTASDLVLFPEMTLTGFSMNVEVTKEANNETIDFVKSLAREYNISIGIGWVKDIGGSAENHYTIIDENEGILADYTKIHSFSFAGEDKHFTSGNSIVQFSMKGYSITPFICYDLRFPELFRTVVGETHIYIIPANWPKARREHWRSLLKARAIENQSYVVGINCVGNVGDLEYSGDSCAITPSGEIVCEREGEAGIIYCNIVDEEFDIRHEITVICDRKLLTQ